MTCFKHLFATTVVALGTTVFTGSTLLFAADSSGKTTLASKILGSYVSGVGVSYSLPTSSYDKGKSGTPFYKTEPSYGIESMHDMTIGMPLGTIHGYGNLSWRKGTTEYYYLNDHPLTPTTASSIDFSSFSFEFGSGPRFRPFPYSFITPVIGAGVGCGILRTEYSDPNIRTKVNGADYSTINYSGFYQAYLELGADLHLGPIGIEALYRKKYWRVVTSDTLPSNLWGYFQEDLVITAVFDF